MKITEVRATPLGSPLEEKLRWGAMSVGVKGGIIVSEPSAWASVASRSFAIRVASRVV